MHPPQRDARVAGFLYLLMAVTAPFVFFYIPGKLIVPGKAAATANNVLASEMLFRVGIVADLITGVIFMLTALALYRLLRGVSQTQAALMVILVMVSVAIGFVNELCNIAALTLFRGNDFLAAFDKPQRDALGMLFLHLHGQGSLINEVFWGLWLFPFGLLVKNSRFLPRLLGVLLIVNGFAYVALSFTSLLAPTYGSVLFKASMPALLGELWIAFWLVIKGVKQEGQTLSAAASGD